MLPEAGKVFVQAESEIAAAQMVYGAAGAGKRVMTSSSSVGIALKQETFSYLCGSQLPCVIVSVMRAGPGLAESNHRKAIIIKQPAVVEMAITT